MDGQTGESHVIGGNAEIGTGVNRAGTGGKAAGGPDDGSDNGRGDLETIGKGQGGRRRTGGQRGRGVRAGGGKAGGTGNG